MKLFTQLIFILSLVLLFSNTVIAMPPSPPSVVPVGGEMFFKGSAILAVLMLGVWAIFRGKE